MPKHLTCTSLLLSPTDYVEINALYVFACFFSVQFCVHSDKKELIQVLADDIHRGADYCSVLYRLCDIIGQGTYDRTYLEA